MLEEVREIICKCAWQMGLGSRRMVFKWRSEGKVRVGGEMCRNDIKDSMQRDQDMEGPTGRKDHSFEKK